MNRGVYTVTSGGLAALARLDAATQNLANVNTAGYKAERLVFRVKPLAPNPGDLLDPVLGRTAAQVVQSETVRDFSPGSVRPSGNPLDVAITGQGFFAVATPRGERYTRQGTFAIDGEGYLVTPHGERVQGPNGDLRLPAGEPRFAEDGSITVDGAAAGQLKLVGFGDRPPLVPEGATLFAPAPGVVPAPLAAADVHLHPGAIEAANVDIGSSMIELVDVARGYESYMHALHQLDQLSERSINDVGHF